MDNKKATLELGTEPVGKLLARYALPAIIAMTAASLYNIIDRVFIGQVVGPLAISGLAITFPFMNLAAAFGAAVGVGASTTISVRLGQRDYDAAENILGNTITLNLIIGIGFGLFSLIFLDPILRFFGASDDTLPYAHDFMTIILAGNVISHMYFGMNAVLRAASKPKKAMAATLFTVVMNVVLDAVFILWWHWGIKGAALATMISQLLALCWQMSIFANQKELLHLKRGIYKLRAELVQNIISIGISPFLMNACACIIVIFMNNQLVRYGGDMAVGAYGIANSIAMVFVLFSMGLNQGMQPIAGYNYGSQQFDRLMSVVKLAIISATVMMTSGWLVAMFAPYYCARMFTTDPELIRQAIDAIQVMMLMFPIIGGQMVITNFFQCIGKVKISIFLSLSRQLLFLLPLLAVLPHFYNIKGVWASLPMSDLAAAIVAAAIMVAYMKKMKKQMNS
ncbi:MATE family efflux transporter [Prevotella corporis]|uniref:Multidrug export protein MepA n=1 Tax=Prevotella corporis TaxID=28128 RepID=A0A133Q5V2_9BACT|nr:MATE family efflux transporter [Prevotella corporis]KXA38245.1 MATE efflux family protein [Prevotella corporis]MDQ7737746.1 MATE family efflux transporter [Prevotella corporis]